MQGFEFCCGSFTVLCSKVRGLSGTMDGFMSWCWDKSLANSEHMQGEPS